MKKKLLLIVIFIVLLLAAQYALAQVQLDNTYKPDYSPTVRIQSDNPADFGNLVLQIIAGGLLTLAAPVAIIIIVIAGLMAVVSHGNQGIMEKAKKTLFAGIIGLVIIIFSWIIVQTAIDLSIQTDDNQSTRQECYVDESGEEICPGPTEERATSSGAQEVNSSETGASGSGAKGASSPQSPSTGGGARDPGQTTPSSGSGASRGKTTTTAPPPD
ncbi:hypothetical protein GF376_02085 [Candidatus Peregrinibacteria bacterium]|nr:hypothetical protein [Candidatus Peregrinibacteria bacterium]